MKNDHEIRGDITAIVINSPKYGRQEALISTSKIDRANDFPGTWCVNYRKTDNKFYVIGNMPQFNGKFKGIKLHRWITDAPDGMEVDHKNHDTLNNTDVNLRVCTKTENLQNRSGAAIHSKSGIRGVCWNKREKKWECSVCVKGKIIRVGYFVGLIEAERAVKEARARLMPYSQEA